MQEIKKEISKEEYERYTEMSYKQFQDETKETIPIEWFCGYGWYGGRLYKDTEDNKYYIIHKIGNSCD